MRRVTGENLGENLLRCCYSHLDLSASAVFPSNGSQTPRPPLLLRGPPAARPATDADDRAILPIRIP